MANRKLNASAKRRLARRKNWEKLIAQQKVRCISKTIEIDYLLPREEWVTPLQYHGVELTKETAIKIITKNVGRKQQCDGLVYLKKQMPSMKNNKEWKFVIRRPTSTEIQKGTAIWAYNLKTKVAAVAPTTCTGNIMVNYFVDTDTDIEPIISRIRQASQTFMEIHKQVRIVKGEYGTMHPAGARVDYCSSTMTAYVGNNAFDKGRSRRQLRQYALDLQQIVMKSICKEDLVRELRNEKQTNKGLTFQDDSGTDMGAMPLYSTSKDLTNSIHIDVHDDSRTFAVYLSPVKKVPGKTFFVFPAISLVIEIVPGMVLSWEAHAMYHCSVTTVKGIIGIALCSNKRTSKHSIIPQAFNTRGHNKGIKVGDTVMARETLQELQYKGVSVPSSADCSVNERPKKKSYRAASVTSVEDGNLEIIYKGKLKRSLGKHYIQSLDACKMDYLDTARLDNNQNTINSKSKQSRKNNSKRKRDMT